MICSIIQQTWTSAVSDRDCAFSNREKLLKLGFEQAFHLPYTDLEIITGPHGKPMVANHPEVHFNLTNTFRRMPQKDLIDAGSSTDPGSAAIRQYYLAGGFADCRLGIDAEYPRPVSKRLYDRVLNSRERDLIRTSDCPENLFLKLWTLKESYLKYTGDGLSVNPASLCFLPDGSGQFILQGHADPVFRQFQMEDGLILSLCTARPCEIRFL